jgi:hypothetical protein
VGIEYFGFHSRVNPKHHDSNLSSSITTIEFSLALPQSTLVTPGTAQNNLLSHFNASTKTPDHPKTPSHSALITLQKLNEMSATKLANLGIATSTDTLETYTADCYPKFTAIQLTALISRHLPPTPQRKDRWSVAGWGT